MIESYLSWPMAFAIAHVLYAGISGISSTCWDSIAEVTALAVNSSPTTAIRNTCAGITEFAIFKLPVCILAMCDEEGESEHLELVFGSVDEKSVENRVIKPNRVDGTMPSVKPSEKMLWEMKRGRCIEGKNVVWVFFLFLKKGFSAYRVSAFVSIWHC